MDLESSSPDHGTSLTEVKDPGIVVFVRLGLFEMGKNTRGMMMMLKTDE